MKFDETELYKYLGAREYKVTMPDGRVIKSKNWIARWDDANNTAHTPHTAKKVEVKRGRKA